MKLHQYCAATLALATLTSSCLATFPSWADAPNDDVSLETAARILEQSVAAHGDVYGSLAEIHVAYSGEWSSLIASVQSVLADVEFRQTSREKLFLADMETADVREIPNYKFY